MKVLCLSVRPWSPHWEQNYNRCWLERSVHTFDIITKTCLCNTESLKSHFYLVKLGFTGVYIISLFLLKNIDWGYSLEQPHRGGSNEYPQSMFWAGIRKILNSFIWKFSFFLVVKFSIYLNRRVIVMCLSRINGLREAFERAWNAQIQMIVRMCKVSSEPLLSFHTFSSIQWFC